MRSLLKFATIWLPLSACLCHSALAESDEDIRKRHPLWMHYENDAKGLVAHVPVDHGVRYGQPLGGPRVVSEYPSVTKIGSAIGKRWKIRGDLRVLEKETGTDVLQTFVDLAKKQDGAKAYHFVMEDADSAKGVYFLSYVNKAGLWVYEKINNEFDGVAISYRLMCKPGSPEEKHVRSMVSDFSVRSK
jgi:hypothetical protein